MEEVRIDSINIRVYALLIKQNSLMFLKEMYAGEQLLKLPGGGLEWGEGSKDTLIREFKEELNLSIEVKEHFYTQDFFLRSKFKENQQLLTIYYRVACNDYSSLKILDLGIKEVIWIPLNQLIIEKIQLPVDKIVIEKLIHQVAM